MEYDRALHAFDNHHYEDTEKDLASALRRNPEDERAISLLGWVRFKQGRIKEAENLFTRAGRLNPENVGTNEGLGWIYYMQGKNESAESKSRKLIQWAEKHFENPNWHDYALKDRQFVQSIYSEASYVLGLIAKRKGMRASARGYFENALNQPNQFIDHEIIANELADILFQLEEYKAAAFLYKKFLFKNPNDPFLLDHYAWCLYQIGNVEEAKDFFLRSKELSLPAAELYHESFGSRSITQILYAKRIAEPYYGLALIYVREKQVATARKELASALKISPYFHHPKEIVFLLSQYPEWQETLRLRPLGRSLP